MKTIFHKATREELIYRINLLNENSIAQWGKMNIYQMLKHCAKWDEMALGKTMYKQVFIGRLFGKMALKSFIKNDSPAKRNVGSFKEIIITETDGSFEPLKKKLVALIEEYGQLNHHEFVHPFFGKVTKEQTGYLAYKHADHHSRQFNI